MNQITSIITSEAAPQIEAEAGLIAPSQTEGHAPEDSQEATKPDATQAEAVEALASVDLPINYVLGALSCASKEETRYYLNGVFVHRIEGRVRMVATDGHRLFIASYQPTLCGTGEEGAQAFPSWLDDGVILSSDRLGPKLKLAASCTDNPCIRVSFAKGAPVAFVSDMADEVTFKVRPVDGTFPDYQRVLSGLTGGVTDTADLTRKDFEPVSFNGTYLRGVGDLSKILVGKDAAVSVYASSKSDASIITFPGAPGTMLVLMPMRADAPIHQETVALMAPAVKGTLAALRAHLTRNQHAVETATDPVEKAKAEEKVVEYEKRIADLLNRTLEQPALPAPEAQTQAEGEDSDESEAVSDGEPIGTETNEPEAQGEQHEAQEPVTEEVTAPEQQAEPEAIEATAEISDAVAETSESEAKARPVSRKERRSQRRKAA